MDIVIGTKNSAKIQALKESLKLGKAFEGANILGLDVDSGISDQPLSLEETLQGAKNRAYNAYTSYSNAPDYSFGVEDGLIETPGTKTGFMHISICCIYDGSEYATGFSTGFEIPGPILRLLTEDKLDLSQACLASGISSNENIGQQEGLVGILTNGKVNRLEYTKECINSALVQLVHSSWYQMQESPHQ